MLSKSQSPSTPDAEQDAEAPMGHRCAVGGKWEKIGLLQFEFLIARGLQPEHYLLDIACGSLRGGVHFIPYLQTGHYLGLDKNHELIRAGIDCELGQSLFKAKEPRFVVSDRFQFRRFSVQPDFALAQSLFTHLSSTGVKQCLRKLRRVIATDGVFYATFFECARKRNNPVKASSDHAIFRYTSKQMEKFGRATGWSMEYVGAWKHPRGQKMVIYRPA